jgi:hypothetical protein
MRAQRIFISIGLILTAVLPAWAQLDLKPILEAAREEHNLSAMGAVVINNGEIGEPCVTGLIGRGMPKPVPADARWHLGSCGGTPRSKKPLPTPTSRSTRATGR